jgi:Mg-chelatase subunit ChlI
MKYKSPAVEDYETDGSPVPGAEKRKRDHKVQQTSDRDDSEQPPNKVSKSTSGNSSSKQENKADLNTNSEEWNNGNKGKEDPEVEEEDVKKGAKQNKNKMKKAAWRVLKGNLKMRRMLNPRNHRKCTRLSRSLAGSH